MYDVHRDYEHINVTDEQRSMWWYLFRFYGAFEAVRLVEKWERD